MKVIVATAAIALLLPSCATTPSEPRSNTAYDRADALEEYQSAFRDREFHEDPFGWGAGRQPKGYAPSEGDW